MILGDHRNSESPGVNTLYTLFLREHNRVAERLASTNKHWDNETIFQETKKIIVALIQHITYTEFLELLLDQETRDMYYLNQAPQYQAPPHQAPLYHYTEYNADLDPRIINGFGIGAFQFFDSLLTNTIGHAGVNFTTTRNMQLQNHFFRPKTVWYSDGRGADFYVRWLTANAMSMPDGTLEDSVRDNLYLDRTTGKSLDQAALHIQRGRDHGIPGYFAYMQHLQVPLELNPLLPSQYLPYHTAANAKKLLDLYRYGFYI